MSYDFHRVPEDQEAMHARLENWARYVRVRNPSRPAPMWRFMRSNSRMWAPPGPLMVVDARDGDALEHAIGKLPTYYAEALRWAYVFRGPPARIARRLNVSYPALARLVVDARSLLMLGNLSITTAAFI